VKTPDPPALPEQLSPHSPKGEQLREIMGGLIAALPPGAALPSERELADRYGVARMTVRTEIDRLVTEGVAYRVHGHGTFVAEHRVAQASALTSFSEDMRERGLRPGSRMLAQDIVVASEQTATELEVGSGTLVVRIHRVRTADGEPMALEQAFLPAGRFAGVEGTDLTDASLFDLLRQRWNVKLETAEQRVVAVCADSLEASLLGVSAGHACLLFRSKVRDENGRPVYVASSLFRGDRYEVRFRQVRR
jgi:GntR family transcriptional regulator